MTAPTDDPYSLADCLAKRDAAIAARALREAADRADSVGHHWSGAPMRAFFVLAEDYRARADEIERAAGGGS